MKTVPTPLHKLVALNDRYMARTAAIGKLVKRERIYSSAIRFGSFLIFLFGIWLFWGSPSLPLLFGIMAVAFLLKLIAMSLLHRFWTLPSQERVRREFPPPEDLQ